MLRQGQFVSGKRQGQGAYVYPNGDQYNGEWALDQRNGKGTYTFVGTNSKVNKCFSNPFND
jgi:radial spoke head protein 1